VFSGEMTDYSVRLWLTSVNAKRLIDPTTNQLLYIVIDSVGGTYDSAKYLRAELKKIPNIVLICSDCASAAGYILATFEGKRLVHRESEVMMHEMYLKNVTVTMINRMNEFESLIHDSDEFNKAMRDVIGLSEDQYYEKIRDKEWTVYGKDIVKLHLADRMVEIRCYPSIRILSPKTCSE
jgi:ATP-dependent protease ClpP protease subunit